jgi:hypothetical protein
MVDGYKNIDDRIAVRHIYSTIVNLNPSIATNQRSKILWSSGYDSRLGPITVVDCERPPVRVRARSFFCLSFGLLRVPNDLVLGVGNSNKVLRGLLAFEVEITT